MANLFEGIEDILPEVFFSELHNPEENKEYHFRLLGWQTPKSAGEGRNDYQIIETLSLEDYTELSLYKGQLFNLHISKPTFQRALIKFLSYNKAGHILKLLKSTDKTLVIEILFNRSSRKMKIKTLKIYEIEGTNQESLIIECPKTISQKVNDGNDSR